MTLDERIEFLMQSIDCHDRQIGVFTEAIGKLVAVSNEDANSIRALARIAEAREKRFSRIEEDR
jgi:hypothetical protein